MYSNSGNNPNFPNEQNFYPSPRRHKSPWKIIKVIILGIIAIFFFSILALLIYFVSIFSNISFEQKPIIVQNNSILKLDFDELHETNMANQLNLFSSRTPKANFFQVIDAIKTAANDDRIIGIYYDGAGSISGVKAKELQVALEEFKKSGKFIYSYLEVASKNEYYNALPSDSIFIPAEGIYEINGFGIVSIFPKGLYDKIGLEFTVAQCEDYKSAAESYKNKKFSDSARFASKVILSQRENEFISTVAERRKLTKEQVIECLNKGFYDSDEMLAAKLADVKASKMQVFKFLYSKCKYFDNQNSKENDDTEKNDGEKNEGEQCDCSNCDSDDICENLISINDYASSIKGINKIEVKDNKNKVAKNDAIAVICGEGAIVSSQESSFFSKETSIVSKEFVKLIRRAKNDKSIKGIIIRINSPGGSVIASEEIYQEIIEAKKVKPVYASMSNVAASGGYYIAMACDTIIAHSQTITGSIGVLAAIPNFSKTLEKLDINADTISNGIGNPFFLNPMLKRNPNDVSLIEKYVYETYKRFLNKVAQSRNKTFDEIRKVAKGRVWTGEDALKNGLVDYLGDFQTSVDLMKQKIGIDKHQQVVLKFYPEELDKWQAFKQLLEDDQFPFGLVDIFSKKANTNRIETISDMLMLPKEMRRQFAYTQILAMIAEKEMVMFALPSLIEVK